MRRLAYNVGALGALALLTALATTLPTDAARAQTAPATQLASTQSASTRPAATQPAFPQAWLGHWTGPMSVDMTGGNKLDGLTMELIVKATDNPSRYTWTIVYDGPPGRQERPYHLDVVNASRGKYVVDEGNDVRLPCTLFYGDTLVSSFEVEGSRLVATYRLVGEVLQVDITSSRVVEAEQEKYVKPSEVKSLQRAELRRRDQ